MKESEILIGGERMVNSRGALLIPADPEITAAAGEHYQRAFELLAERAERGRAPWMVKRDLG